MKIITAIGNPEINERLKLEKNYEVIGRDIQYQEGILEILEEKEDIEILLISNNLPEEIEFKLLISKIINLNKKLDIIVFLREKDEEIELFLNSKKIYKIYYLKNYKAFFDNINLLETSKEEISKNIEDFKSMIIQQEKFLESNNIIQENKILKNNKNIDMRNVTNKSYLSRGRIISTSGVYGAGKSIISIIMAKYLSKYKKVLLVDSDIFNNSINTILGITKTKYEKNQSEIINNVSKYKENFYILNLYRNNLENVNYTYIVDFFENLREEFDFIIIDTSADLDSNQNNIIFSLSDKVIVLIEPNLSEVKKSNLYLEKVIKDFEIQKTKINIIFNKINKYKISNRVLKEIYSEISIIGEINYSEKYNLIINKNIFKEIDLYENIFEKLLE